MSHMEDTCDFCDCYIDPIGGDLAHTVTVNGEPKYWCGTCQQGEDAQFSHLSDSELIRDWSKFQTAYNADPIEWEKAWGSKGTNVVTFEDQRAHARRLALHDAAGFRATALEKRGINVQQLPAGWTEAQP